VPSGGDWALERMGALFFERTEGLVVNGITMTRMGGNGIMLSKYAPCTTGGGQSRLDTRLSRAVHQSCDAHGSS